MTVYHVHTLAISPGLAAVACFLGLCLALPPILRDFRRGTQS